MTLTVDLSEHAEAKLREAASRLGLDVRDYAARLLETLAPASLDAMLEPFRRQVAESGMSDQQLDAFFDELIAKTRKDKSSHPDG